MPQFLVTGLSTIIFALAEPAKLADDPAIMADTPTAAVLSSVSLRDVAPSSGTGSSVAYVFRQVFPTSIPHARQVDVSSPELAASRLLLLSSSRYHFTRYSGGNDILKDTLYRWIICILCPG